MQEFGDLLVFVFADRIHHHDVEFVFGQDFVGQGDGRGSTSPRIINAIRVIIIGEIITDFPIPFLKLR
jgi:hypothetical protein